MNNGAQDGPRDTTTANRQAANTARRAAAQRASAGRAAARSPRQLAVAVASAVATFGLIAVVAVGCGGSKDPQRATSEPSTSTVATVPGFPPLPAGADPALATKPAAGAGTGNLEKLTVTPLVEGKGEPVKAGQRISVNYVGVSYTTGKEFDSSWSRSEPFSFTVGQGRVIKGWDQGLLDVKVGSRVQLDIPSDLAYGDKAAGGAPTGPLRFVVDVLFAQ